MVSQGLRPGLLSDAPLGRKQNTMPRLPDMRQLVFLSAALALLAGGSRVLADAKNPTYEDDVMPIVKQSCVNCHGNDKQKGGLNLATYAAMKQGGSSGEVVKAGDPAKSRIYTLAAHLEEPKM